MDAFTASRVDRMRDAGHLHGFAFSSDESPPSANRFCGLRFQITYAYLPIFKDINTWELYADRFPMDLERHLTDIVHCPSKLGNEVLKVMEKQWATLGLTRWDAHGGTGDRGGENMGYTGIHSIMEESNESYVGKICLAHLSWRVCDAGIRVMHSKKVEAIETYVRDGITWSRLKTIATASLEHGGLALFAEASEESVNFFSRAPPKILEDRPETNAEFLEWLVPRQDVLAKLVAHDLSRRNLTMPQAQQALASLTDRMECVLRHIDLVLIKKGLYLFYLSKSCHTVIDGDRCFEDVLTKAKDILTNKFVDDHVLEVIGLSWAELHAIGWTERTNLQWLEVVILLIPGMGQAECNEMFEEVVKYHDMVAIKMATHLQGVALNIETRGSMLASQILSKDPAKAQNGAQRLRDHILGTHPDKRSKFDNYILNSHDLWSELLQFASRAVACVVWHGHGAFQHLFVFLVLRLATAPDTVLDCEGTHAKWKWLMDVKRGISFKMMWSFRRVKVQG